ATSWVEQYHRVRSWAVELAHRWARGGLAGALRQLHPDKNRAHVWDRERACFLTGGDLTNTAPRGLPHFGHSLQLHSPLFAPRFEAFGTVLHRRRAGEGRCATRQE